jgi:hypothetical protein
MATMLDILSRDGARGCIKLKEVYYCIKTFLESVNKNSMEKLILQYNQLHELTNRQTRGVLFSCQ